MIYVSAMHFQEIIKKNKKKIVRRTQSRRSAKIKNKKKQGFGKKKFCSRDFFEKNLVADQKM